MAKIRRKQARFVGSVFSHILRYRLRDFQSVAAQSSITSGVAGRYAAALFDLAKEADALDLIAEDLQGELSGQRYGRASGQIITTD